MTIDEAIQVLESRDKDFARGWNPPVGEAVKLGIEALWLVKQQRGHRWVDAPKLLPGETDE